MQSSDGKIFVYLNKKINVIVALQSWHTHGLVRSRVTLHASHCQGSLHLAFQKCVKGTPKPCSKALGRQAQWGTGQPYYACVHAPQFVSV